MKKVRAMLQTAHFFFDEQHENLHDIIEADAKTIFPTSNIKNDILTQLISERCYKHLTKESDYYTRALSHMNLVLYFYMIS